MAQTYQLDDVGVLHERLGADFTLSLVWSVPTGPYTGPTRLFT